MFSFRLLTLTARSTFVQKTMMTSSKYHTFQQLHTLPEPLLLSNVWDARSTMISQESGFKAIATSSAAMASMLGYADGEKVPFSELLAVVKRIAAVATVPVTVDIEAGYSRNVAIICSHIEQLHQLGVVGINIEDSVADEARKLVDIAFFARTLEQLKTFCLNNGIDVFVNARTDTYLLPIEERGAQTAARIRTYEAAGADGIFIPGLTSLAEIKVFCQQTSLPLNVMCMPDLPGFNDLTTAGVKRISMGNFLFESLARKQAKLSAAIRQEGNFNALFQ